MPLADNQRKPDWEMPSSNYSGKRGPGRSPSIPRASSTTRDAKSNGTAHQPKKSPIGNHIPLPSSQSAGSSRETSPDRAPLKNVNTISSSKPISRKNSQEFYTSRNSSTTSVGNTSIPATDLQTNPVDSSRPHLAPPPTDAQADLSQLEKSTMPTKSGDPPLQWPILNRLKSPPPSLQTRTPLQRTTSPKRLEHDGFVANSSSKRYHGGGENPLSPDKSPEMSEDVQYQNLSRGSGRGIAPVLETVQEGSVQTVPTIDLSTAEESGNTVGNTKPAGDSGSDSGGRKNATVKGSIKQNIASITPKGEGIIPKRSFTSLSSARGKPAETSTTNMTVETETVSSIPQVSLGGGAGERGGARKDGGMSLRLRPSDETIRPKKEKKKRKPVVAPGTGSSKADIFEAKVASAVDDADSSDSAETFVYESNPPDPNPPRQRYHSRTPSGASMVGQFDQYGNRLRSGARDLHGIVGKRSMKFNNASYNTMDNEYDDRSAGRGSSRGNGHMHTGRHYNPGRPGRNGFHHLISDQAPFHEPQSPKSPRRFMGNGRNFKKDGDTYGYDFEAEGADDERTPLVGGIRGIRGRNRRPNSASLRQMEYMEHRRIGFCARYGICALLLMLIFVITGGSISFIIGATQPLRDVRIREIQNVLASEQTIMLDLDIQAVNPNIFALTISDMDVNIFAKSRYVGSDLFWRENPFSAAELPRTKESKKRALMARSVRDKTTKDLAPSAKVNATGSVDHGTDPMPDDGLTEDPQTMLLGRIFHFASPLTFDPSPWTQLPSNSTGQVRVSKPGNKTEEGGTLRWERVLQHPFELIVRGVVKYRLPLGSGTKSASISSKISVVPGDSGDGDNDDDGDGKGGKDKHPKDSVPGDSVHTS